MDASLLLDRPCCSSYIFRQRMDRRRKPLDTVKEYSLKQKMDFISELWQKHMSKRSGIYSRDALSSAMISVIIFRRGVDRLIYKNSAHQTDITQADGWVDCKQT